MAAPRRWTDAQRAAVYALHQQGCKPMEIRRRLLEGTASVDAVDIPRKTIENIARAIERERGEAPPPTLPEVANGAAFKSRPDRIGVILDAEIARIQAKSQAGKALTAADQSTLARCARTHAVLDKSARPATGGEAKRREPVSGPPTLEDVRDDPAFADALEDSPEEGNGDDRQLQASPAKQPGVESSNGQKASLSHAHTPNANGSPNGEPSLAARIQALAAG